MGIFLFFILALPCSDQLSELQNHYSHFSTKRLDLAHVDTKLQSDITRAFGFAPTEVNDDFWRGLLFLEAQFHPRSLNRVVQGTHITGPESLAFLEKMHVFFKFHPKVLRTVAEDVGLLLRHHQDTKNALGVEALLESLRGLRAAIYKDKLERWQQGLAGAIEELRAAAYLVRKGYHIREVNRHFKTTLFGLESHGEIDLIVENPRVPGELILVEVKSSLENQRKHQKQFTRYHNFYKNQEFEGQKVSGLFLILTRGKPEPKHLNKFLRNFPNFRVLYFSEHLTTDAIFYSTNSKSQKSTEPPTDS